jgi:hypothetical protein
VKQSKQDLIMITGILAILASVFALGSAMPTQDETASDIRAILSTPKNLAMAKK